MKTIYFIIVTILFLVVMYILGVEKTSTSAMEWKSFKMDPKILIVSVLLYSAALYILYKIKI
ncbi:hypothetical protein AB9K32_14650 [Allomuricauda sp. XS_ASV26]|uniref:Uncharacterized protein n=1 Tax=Flagellimonas oceani TaxID=2698672 RepID=A0A6G7J5T7_9FLAO|nr:hypothetical protein [Allomuricauda oceani]MBW8245244.1 hypothetical protein [Allomuricauda oceani]QII46195.1 hypothetical protein GVT53_16415 [Allomuricauda oceani]